MFSIWTSKKNVSFEQYNFRKLSLSKVCLTGSNREVPLTSIFKRTCMSHSEYNRKSACKLVMLSTDKTIQNMNIFK